MKKQEYKTPKLKINEMDSELDILASSGDSTAGAGINSTNVSGTSLGSSNGVLNRGGAASGDFVH